MPNIQVFGMDDSNPTRAALRFFRERRIVVHYVDLRKKPIAAGELRRFIDRLGAAALLDTDESRLPGGRACVSVPRCRRDHRSAAGGRAAPPPAAGPLRGRRHGRQGRGDLARLAGQASLIAAIAHDAPLITVALAVRRGASAAEVPPPRRGTPAAPSRSRAVPFVPEIDQNAQSTGVRVRGTHANSVSVPTRQRNARWRWPGPGACTGWSDLADPADILATGRARRGLGPRRPAYGGMLRIA